MSRTLESNTPVDDEAATVVLGRQRALLEENVSPRDQSQYSSTERDISPTRRRCRSRKLLPTVEGDKVIAERFRTKLCRNYLQHPDRPCPYEDRCMFAHGDHELRTAAQNVADGLMSEDAIRDFKHKESDGAGSTSLSRSSSIGVPAAALSRLIVPQARLHIKVPLVTRADPRWTPIQVSQDHSDRGSNSSHAIAAKNEPLGRAFLARTPSDASPSSSVTSASTASATLAPQVPPSVQYAYPYRYYQSGECLIVPRAIAQADEEEESRIDGPLRSIQRQTYIHDPYAWRAV